MTKGLLASFAILFGSLASAASGDYVCKDVDGSGVFGFEGVVRQALNEVLKCDRSMPFQVTPVSKGNGFTHFMLVCCIQK